MNEYHKIKTIWMRDPKTNFKRLLSGQWSTPEFEALRSLDWEWTEKIDGTNIRVDWDGTAVRFGGKTDNAQIPESLAEHLRLSFTPELFKSLDLDPMTLYGEGFGEKIQRGGLYRPGRVDFCLFDVRCGLWLERSNVEDVACKVGCCFAPVVGRGPLIEAADMMISDCPDSVVAEKKRPMEGYIMRPTVELLTRRGDRIIAKVKRKDFE